MITEEYLNDFKKEFDNYKYELSLINKEIWKHEQNVVIDSVSGTSKEYPYTQQHYTLRGIDKKSQKILEKLKAKKKYLEIRKDKLERQFDYKIKEVKNKRFEEILGLRFKKGLSWNEIAINFEYSGESVPRMKYNRFFGKNI